MMSSRVRVVLCLVCGALLPRLIFTCRVVAAAENHLCFTHSTCAKITVPNARVEMCEAVAIVVGECASKTTGTTESLFGVTD